MKVNKFINSKIERPLVFVKGRLSLPFNYFIKEIEKGIAAENNENFKTNLISQMTNYKYFNNDKEMIKLLLPIFDLIEKNNLNDNDRFILADSWGFKMSFSHQTKKHRHCSSMLGGAIMLNKHPQKLYFPEINEEVESNPGNFVLFSGFLSHYNNRNTSDDIRYGLSFNLNYGNT